MVHSQAQTRGLQQRLGDDYRVVLGMRYGEPGIERAIIELEREGIDRILVGYDGLLSASARLYAGDHDLKNPLLSPLYGDFQGFPPTYLVTGTRDLFLSDVVRTHRKLREAGVVADLNVYEGVSHADYLVMPTSPESQQVFAELGGFLRQHLQ